VESIFVHCGSLQHISFYMKGSGDDYAAVNDQLVVHLVLPHTRRTILMPFLIMIGTIPSFGLSLLRGGLPNCRSIILDTAHPPDPFIFSPEINLFGIGSTSKPGLSVSGLV